MADPTIKVTDRRMFTLDGELREEYRFLEDAVAEEPAPAQAAAEAAPPSPPQAGPPAAEPPHSGPPAAEPPAARAAEPPAGTPAAAPAAAPPGFAETGADVGPRFYDLVAALAEPASVYLGDQPTEDGGPIENLELARFYIDLLDVLRQSTEGNLPPQEASFLEDVLYQLRVRYVQKRG